MNFADFNMYHIFTMGFCDGETFQGACDGVQHRLYKVEKLVDYLKRLGINTILLGPLFSSESHGYDTTDYYNVDKRLGTNEDFQELVSILHDEGFRVIIDCVFNHVGRAFFAFQDLQANRENSRYKDWFLEVNFFNDNSYNDGFSYADWAGCNNLVKLNLFNPEVKTYLKEVALFWFNQFGIDGLRMDAANVMSLEFL
ncbi:MAG: alpha-amylase family glycosyl hydrolase, partial [Eubacterium sp.]